MAEDKFADEMLTDDELDGVVGGTHGELDKDRAFFSAVLGVDTYRGYETISREFAKHGVTYSFDAWGDNTYRMDGGDGNSNQKHPRLAALGLVLAKMNYPGYDGNWRNCAATENFIRTNISSDAV